MGAVADSLYCNLMISDLSFERFVDLNPVHFALRQTSNEGCNLQ